MGLLKFIQGFKAYTVVWLVLFLGVSLTGSSFFIEHVLNEQPCPMCLWQRYSHMVLWGAALFFILTWRVFKHPGLVLTVFLLIGVYSGGVGLYQGAGQQGWVELPQSCTGGGVQLLDVDNLLLALTNTPKIPNCADMDFSVLGLTLAWWNFIIMLSMVSCLTIWLIKKRR